MKQTKTFLLIALAFFAGSFVSLFTTLAFAHGGETNWIHACIKDKSGTVHIVGATVKCAKNETALDWNALGLPGTGGLVDNLQGADLSSLDFRYRNLKGINFSKANVSLVNFEHADLAGTNFSNANVANGKFDSNNLSSSNFSYSDLSNAHFTNVNLTNTTITGANLNAMNLTKVTLTNKDLRNNLVNSINTEESNLAGINISGQFFSAIARFYNTNLSKANFSSITTNLDGEVNRNPPIVFQASNLTQTNFTNASLKYADFTLANGSQTNFTNANLEHAIFEQTNLSNPIWSNTICPDGTISNSHGNTCTGHLNAQ